jgi:hypothetical protein
MPAYSTLAKPRVIVLVRGRSQSFRQCLGCAETRFTRFNVLRTFAEAIQKLLDAGLCRF